jgi:copper(I)-binding protein
VTRFKNRVFAATAALAACGVILTGCGSGQISQVASQESGVNGNAATVKNIALRNIYLEAVQTGDFLQPGRVVPLMFLAANNSPDLSDKLVSITSDVGTVALTGDGTIAPGGALVYGAGPGQADQMSSATAPTAAVTLTQPITNGLSYKFTFNFERAGSTTVAVPISAPELTKQ